MIGGKCWQGVVARNTLLLLLLGMVAHIAAAEPAKNGPDKRTPWTTSRITGSPEPPRPYISERAFPALTFNHCLDLTAAPGSDRLFIVEQSGKIFSFPDQPDAASADLVIDLAKAIPGVEQVYALAFPPDFETSRLCYVCYIKAANKEDGSHIARFRMADANPPTIDPKSEETILTWLSGGHNGCCLKFGPDGYLYISTGDGGPANPPDPLKAGQDVSNLLSAILRIDVSPDAASQGDGKKYRIPADNPLVNLPNARGEIWAYGLRNPWRMSFDRQGNLWAGDVGWELWEMLYRIERGGNYGWAVTEGSHPTHPEWPRGPTPILLPTIEHPHSESSSITDGLTYYGSRLKELRGMHVYGDYDTGKMWGFRYENDKVVGLQELADTTHRIVGFGEGRDGELYLLDHVAGMIYRLAPNPLRNQESEFPKLLSETGLFSSVVEHAPATGVLPYSINAEPWADYATSERLVAVPGEESIQANDAAWNFPKNSVLVRTFSLEMERGKSSSRRRLETQILHFDGLDWQPYTYRWNESQTDAELVDAAGAEQELDVVDPDAPNGKRRQTWRFSSRAECQRCHNKWSGPPLGFNTPQMNKTHDYEGTSASQLDTLSRIGLVKNLPPRKKGNKLVDPYDSAAEVNARARSYLHANCSHCHRMHAGGAVLSKMTNDLPLEKTDMPGVRPTQGTFGIHAAAVIAPGDPARSVLWYRMAKLGAGKMPHLGSTEVDRQGLDLIYRWIEQMPESVAAKDHTKQGAAKLRAELQSRLEELRKAARPEEQVAPIESLLSSTSGGIVLLRCMEEGSLPTATTALVIEQAARHSDASVRDLFERFLPAEQRIKRLGSAVRPEQILSLPGNAARGKELFFAASAVQCKSCHRISNEGTEVGPDLTAIGKKLTRPQLLESILEPSKTVDPKHVAYLLETKEGRVLTGLLVARNEKEVVLKDARNNTVRIAAEDVEQLVPQRQSLMPDLLLRDMTAQQAADLLEFLSGLK